MACRGERPRLGAVRSRARARVTIYHFSAKVISRASGHSTVAAAYRSASALLDERTARTHDFNHKVDVVHSENLLPAGAPERWTDRAVVWSYGARLRLRRSARMRSLLARSSSHRRAS